MSTRRCIRPAARFLSSGLVVALVSCPRPEDPPPPAPPTVGVADVVRRDVPLFAEAIGRTRGSRDVEIRARVEGFVDRVAFQEGTFAEKGQLLYELDPRPFEAALAQARASLAQAEASWERARQDLARLSRLVEQNAVSRQQYDAAVAAERTGQAGVEAARAAVARAELDLGYTRVAAPLSGLVGSTLVNEGTLVGAGQTTLLTTISVVDPIAARFHISEREYLRYVRKRRRQQTQGVEAPPPEFDLILADGTRHPHRGRFSFAEREVDPRTGTLMIEALFPNPERILRPGQFVRVRVETDRRPSAVLVPRRAIQELQGLYNVAVVGPDGTVEIRFVDLGPMLEEHWLVEDGLEGDERVVVEGHGRDLQGRKVAAVPANEGEAPPGAAEVR